MAKNPMRDMSDGRKDLYTFDPDKLVIITDPKHPLFDERAALPVDEDMVRNVMHYGVLQPILYRTEEINGETVPVVVAGRQRVKAAREANRRLRERGEVPLQVPGMVRRAGDGEAIGLLVSENEVRRADDVIVKAAKARRMMETYSYTEEQCAMTFGVSTATLRRYLAVEGATVEVKEAFVKGELPIGAAVDLSKLPPSKQREQLDAMREAGKAGAGKKHTGANDAAAAAAREAGVGGKERQHLRSIKQVKALQEYLGENPPCAKDRAVYDAITTIVDWTMGQEELSLTLLLEKLQMALPKGASDKKEKK